MGTDGSNTVLADEALYFFPEERLTRGELEEILAADDVDRKAWAVSHLLRYAVWDDIWKWTSRDQVRELFVRLDLSPALRSSLARMLKVDAGVLAGK